MTTKAHIAEGATLSEDANGIVEVQVWDVPASGTGSAFLWNARKHGTPPALGKRNDIDPRLVVVRRTVVDSGGGRARITVEYGLPVATGNEAPGTVIDVRYDGTVVVENRKSDIYGNPMISGVSAYTAAISVGAALIEVDVVERASPGHAYLSQFMNHTNSSPFGGFPARSLLLYAPRSRALAANFLTTHIIGVDLKTWDKELEEIRIESIEYTTEGGAFSPGSPTFAIKSVDSIINKYRTYPSVDFARLGFTL